MPGAKSLMEALRSVVVAPIRPISRSVPTLPTISGVPSRRIDDEPCSTMASIMPSAMASRASDQPMRSH
jgi:hypothetical protein